MINNTDLNRYTIVFYDIYRIYCDDANQQSSDLYLDNHIYVFAPFVAQKSYSAEKR